MNPLFAATLTVKDINKMVGKKDTNKLLLQQNADGLSPIAYHAQRGDWDLVNALANHKIEEGEDIKAQYGEALRLCMLQILSSKDAERTKLIALAKKLLAQGASGIYTSEYQQNIVHLAIFIGDDDLFDAALKTNADLRQSVSNVTPLFQAIMEKRFDYALKIAKEIEDKFIISEMECDLLIDKAKAAIETQLVNVLQKIKTNNTWEKIEAPKLAEMAGKDIRNLQNPFPEELSPLHIFIKQEKWNHVELFAIDKYMSIENWLQVDLDGKSPLMKVAEKGKWHLVEAVIKKISKDKFNLYVNPEHINQIRKIAALPEKDLTMDPRAKESLQRMVSEVDVFPEQFKRVYEAMYKAQSSILKRGEGWHKPEKTLDVKQILDYANKHPNSRTAKAVKLTLDYLKDNDERKLIKDIHTYGKDRSSSVFGLFKRSLNANKLDSDAALDVKENSRTGKIISSLKPSGK